MDSLPFPPGDPDPHRIAVPPPGAAGAAATRDPVPVRRVARRLLPAVGLLAAGVLAAPVLRHRFGAALGGTPALAGTALLLPLAALLATLLVGLLRPAAAEDAAGRRNLACRLSGAPHGLIPIAAGIAGCCWLLRAPSPPLAPAPSLAVACLLAMAAFPVLLAERTAAAVSPALLPEQRRLAACLRLPVAVLLILAGLFAIADAVPVLVRPALQGLRWLLLFASAETALRPALSWFSPPAAPGAARAAVGSLPGALLHPGGLAPRSLAQSVRSRFGIDFARSWALFFVRRAALPVSALLLCFAWALSGVQTVGLAQRGQYERFGAPVAVLQPGLHLLLPWPFGRTRRSELGQVHVLDVAADDEPAAAAAPGRVGAEDAAPAGADRLWDGSSPDISYLVARADGTRQSFEAVSVDLRVLWRIGADDAAVRDSLYDVADPALLVRVQARRLLAHFLAGQTLPSVMDQRRERIAGLLRAELQRALDRDRSGVEIVGLLIDSLHPPVGAAAAYRQVQAAEITARTEVSQERGRIAGTLAVARRDAHDTLDGADAEAAELRARADGDARRMRGDVLAARVGGAAFPFERRLDALSAALSGRGIEVLDHRLTFGAIDLRGAGGAASAAPIDPGPDQAGVQRP